MNWKPPHSEYFSGYLQPGTWSHNTRYRGMGKEIFGTTCNGHTWSSKNLLVYTEVEVIANQGPYVLTVAIFWTVW